MGPAVPTAVVRRPDEIALDEARRLDAAARSPFQTVSYARALQRADLDARVVSVERAGERGGHTVVVEQRALGFRRWEGMVEPAAGPLGDRRGLWEGILGAARGRGVVSASWRDATLVRLGEADAAALQQEARDGGGILQGGTCGTYTVDLRRASEERWTALDKRHRNVIRRARDEGVVVERAEPGSFLDDYMALSQVTWSHSDGEGPPVTLLGALVEEGAAAGWLRAYLARGPDGAPAAGAMVTAFQEAGRYVYGAAERQTTGAAALLQWAVMEALAGDGFATYDLGGVEAPHAPMDDERTRGIRRFKRRFGGTWSAWPRVHLTVRPRAYRVARTLARTAYRFGWRPSV